MALTIAEAIAVNELLSYLLPLRRGIHKPDARAKGAAKLLAAHADKSLHAGVTDKSVALDWEQE
jgi:hypothetical protein